MRNESTWATNSSRINRTRSEPPERSALLPQPVEMGHHDDVAPVEPRVTNSQAENDLCPQVFTLQSDVQTSYPNVVLRRVGVIAQFRLQPLEFRLELALDIGVLRLSIHIVDFKRISVQIV